jgi:hypothetical protein
VSASRDGGEPGDNINRRTGDAEEEGRGQARLLMDERQKNGCFPKRPSAPKGGTGWGGEAKGASTSRITADAHGEAIRALSRDPANKAHKENLAAEMLAVVVQVAREGDAETARIQAADKAMDRLMGKAVQVAQLEHGGPGAFVIMGEPETEDASAWQAKHAK